MMRLTKDNIKFVRRLEMDGITYCWFVSMKSGKISDSREYVNFSDGHTVVKDYPMESLPVAVRKFILDHPEKITDEEVGTASVGYKMYTIM